MVKTELERPFEASNCICFTAGHLLLFFGDLAAEEICELILVIERAFLEDCTEYQHLRTWRLLTSDMLEVFTTPDDISGKCSLSLDDVPCIAQGQTLQRACHRSCQTSIIMVAIHLHSYMYLLTPSTDSSIQHLPQFSLAILRLPSLRCHMYMLVLAAVQAIPSSRGALFTSRLRLRRYACMCVSQPPICRAQPDESSPPHPCSHPTSNCSR